MLVVFILLKRPLEGECAYLVMFTEYFSQCCIQFEILLIVLGLLCVLSGVRLYKQSTQF